MTSSWTGKVIDGRYELLHPLGEGAMGFVFRARDTEGNDVALKIVRAVDENLRADRRFLREVASLNQLVHPNIVELLDFGVDEDSQLSYLVMELIAGDPVSKLTAAGRARAPLALAVARQAAEGLAGAHRRGIVHRDLKPANLMLAPNPDGRVTVKVLDFGLAWMHAADTRLTKTGTAPGTVSYMSPEQLQGEQVDGRADVYGLGVILFEMLCGRPPFEGGNQVETAMAVLSHEAPRIDLLHPEVPTMLGDLVAACLEKDRRRRPEDADELVDRIATIQRQSGVAPLRVRHVGPADDVVTAWALVPRG